MLGKLSKFIFIFALHGIHYSVPAQTREERILYADLRSKKKRLLQLQKKNLATLDKLSESEFSARIKVKSNLAIIATELQNIQDQLEALNKEFKKSTKSIQMNSPLEESNNE